MDKRSVLFLWAGAAALLLMLPTSSSASQGPGSDLFSALKPGQWIQLEGVPQRDGSVLCTEVKIITGDFMDDDWELRAVVRRVDPTTRQFAVGRYPIRLKETTEFDDDGVGKLKGFSDLRVGMLVQVEGTYMRDGSFLCDDVNDEGARRVKKPDIDGKVQIQGKIERVDPARRSITAMGTPFVVSGNTKVKSAIK